MHGKRSRGESGGAEKVYHASDGERGGVDRFDYFERLEVGRRVGEGFFNALSSASVRGVHV